MARNRRRPRGPSAPSGDRRQAPRAPMVAAVLERRGSSAALAQGVDIGVRGMAFVRVADAPPVAPGEPVSLRFQLPGDGDAIELDAEVVSDRPLGRFRATGVRFARVAESAARRIASYVSALIA